MSNDEHDRNDRRPAYVYVLTDPQVGAIRYVGQTWYPETRLAGHCCKSGTTPKDDWIKRLGGKPELRVVEETTRKHINERERYWVRRFYDAGADLLNVRIPLCK